MTALSDVIDLDSEFSSRYKKYNKKDNSNFASFCDKFFLALGKEKYSNKNLRLSNILSRPEIELLEEVAYKILKNKSNNINADEVFKLLDNIIKTKKYSDLAIEDITKLSFLKEENGVYSFKSKFIRNYLAAQYLKEKLTNAGEEEKRSLAKELATKRIEAEYAEVLKILVGLIVNEEKISIVLLTYLDIITDHTNELREDNIHSRLDRYLDVIHEIKLEKYLKQLSKKYKSPNNISKKLQEMQDFVDKTVSENFGLYKNSLIEHEYISEKIINKFKSLLAERLLKAVDEKLDKELNDYVELVLVTNPLLEDNDLLQDKEFLSNFINYIFKKENYNNFLLNKDFQAFVGKFLITVSNSDNNDLLIDNALTILDFSNKSPKEDKELIFCFVLSFIKQSEILNKFLIESFKKITSEIESNQNSLFAINNKINMVPGILNELKGTIVTREVLDEIKKFIEKVNTLKFSIFATGIEKILLKLQELENDNNVLSALVLTRMNRAFSEDASGSAENNNIVKLPEKILASLKKGEIESIQKSIKELLSVTHFELKNSVLKIDKLLDELVKKEYKKDKIYETIINSLSKINGIEKSDDVEPIIDSIFTKIAKGCNIKSLINLEIPPKKKEYFEKIGISVLKEKLENHLGRESSLVDNDIIYYLLDNASDEKSPTHEVSKSLLENMANIRDKNLVKVINNKFDKWSKDSNLAYFKVFCDNILKSKSNVIADKEIENLEQNYKSAWGVNTKFSNEEEEKNSEFLHSLDGFGRSFDVAAHIIPTVKSYFDDQNIEQGKYLMYLLSKDDDNYEVILLITRAPDGYVEVKKVTLDSIETFRIHPVNAALGDASEIKSFILFLNPSLRTAVISEEEALKVIDEVGEKSRAAEGANLIKIIYNSISKEKFVDIFLTPNHENIEIANITRFYIDNYEEYFKHNTEYLKSPEKYAKQIEERLEYLINHDSYQGEFFREFRTLFVNEYISASAVSGSFAKANVSNNAVAAADAASAVTSSIPFVSVATYGAAAGLSRIQEINTISKANIISRIASTQEDAKNIASKIAVFLLTNYLSDNRLTLEKQWSFNIKFPWFKKAKTKSEIIEKLLNTNNTNKVIASPSSVAQIEQDSTKVSSDSLVGLLKLCMAKGKEITKKNKSEAKQDATEIYKEVIKIILDQDNEINSNESNIVAEKVIELLKEKLFSNKDSFVVKLEQEFKNEDDEDDEDDDSEDLETKEEEVDDSEESITNTIISTSVELVAKNISKEEGRKIAKIIQNVKKESGSEIDIFSTLHDGIYDFLVQNPDLYNPQNQKKAVKAISISKKVYETLEKKFDENSEAFFALVTVLINYQNLEKLNTDIVVGTICNTINSARSAENAIGNLLDENIGAEVVEVLGETVIEEAPHVAKACVIM